MQIAIDKLLDVLHNTSHFEQLLRLCTDRKVYLVGGVLRDALIGRPVTDLDLIFPEDPTSLAKTFARRTGGHWFWLDKDRRQSRVVGDRDNKGLHYDFALFRAPDLERDLLDRDFTINAIALPLSADLRQTTLVDPCRGLEDLQRKSLRMVSDDSFHNDPLRILKGVRHAAALDLLVDRATLRAMQNESAGLEGVAVERLRQEVWKILADAGAARGLQLLDESRAGGQLFGAGFAAVLPELTARLATCRSEWQTLVTNAPLAGDWLAEDIEQGLSNETLLLFTLLLSSIERGLAFLLAEKWHLSRNSRASIASVTALDMDTLKDFAAIARNARAYAWWAARRRINPRLLLLALAVTGSQESGVLLEELQFWVPLVASFGDKRPDDLVDGHWLRENLHIKDGPVMKKALELLRNAEIYGQVSSKQEARQFLAGHYQNRIDKVNFDTL